jgi:hypothetical protein
MEIPMSAKYVLNLPLLQFCFLVGIFACASLARLPVQNALYAVQESQTG